MLTQSPKRSRVRSSPAMSGVPVNATNNAFGRAARMLVASVSYWDQCASSAITITSRRLLSTSAVWNLWIRLTLTFPIPSRTN